MTLTPKIASVYSQQEPLGIQRTFCRAIDLLECMERRSSLEKSVRGVSRPNLHNLAPWWTARLHPSQNTIALLFSPSESSQILHVESSEGSA